MLLIKGGRVPGLSRTCDIMAENGKIAAVSENIEPVDGVEMLDASQLYVAPGLVDMHVHLRDPGFEYKENILTGAAAAAAGGVTTCVCMPNTSPVIGNPEIVRYILEKAKNLPVRILPYAAVTMGQKGRELTNFEMLKDAGAVALSDDGNPVQNAAVMRLAMQYARDADMLISSHCEDDDMAQNYAVNEGPVSEQLDLPGRPAIAEELMVARDALLAKETGARVHIAHVSSAGSVEIIRRAKAEGIAITAETCPQYFSLTEDIVLTKGSIARVNPPLRTQRDIEAIIKGLIDGTIDAIATDHAPHSAVEKSRPLESALSGMIGLETSLAAALTYLYHPGYLKLEEVIKRMSTNPAKILGLNAGSLRLGAPADFVLFDPNEEWTVEPDKFQSKARNTPFAGAKLRGRVRYTVCGGKVVFKLPE